MMDQYSAMLAKKRKDIETCSVPLDCARIPECAFDYQRRIIEWSMRIGRAAIFADCGLGKTLMQVCWADAVARHTGKPVLILAPLAITSQTVRDGKRFGFDIEYSKVGTGPSTVVVSNYDRMDECVSDYGGIVLDESSILKSMDGATKTALIEKSRSYQYRLACTATPAPNDYQEIGNHAEFLGVCSRQEMLSEYFIHDTSGTTDSWRIKGHARNAFWEWCARWAVAIRKPSDVGGDDTRHNLPKLSVVPEIVTPDVAPTDGMLFRAEALSLSDMRTEQRENMPARVSRVASVVATDAASQWIVWVHTNAESEACVKAIPGAVQLTGSQTPEEKADAVIKFAAGEIRVIVTKPSIAGFGVNWQNCCKMVWASISYSYEQFYQAVRRCWRFGQKSEVTVHCVFAETESRAWRAIQSKQSAGDDMMEQMVSATRRVGLDMDRVTSARRTGYEISEHKSDKFTAFHGDCVEAWSRIASESVGFTIFSPPFASLYTYSDSERDMGNCSDDDQFAEHFSFLIPELLRTTIPGRLCAVHCMQLTSSKMAHGEIGMRDFRGAIIKAFVDAGWIYHSEVTIWKDPVTAMQRTKAIGLLHKQLCKDSSMSRQGIADYLCVFRKPGKNPEPVSRESSARFSEYVGTDGPTSNPDTDPRRYSIDVWQRYASPVWFDIDQSRTLQYTTARSEDDERHICPLQLDVIERAIDLWSNPGDLVASPFMGIGSETFSAIKMGRRAIGAELKDSYFRIALQNMNDAANPPQQSLL